MTRTVAYDFCDAMADAVASGRVCQTIRRMDADHARRGDRVHLTAGHGTADCRALVDPDPVCVHSLELHAWIDDDTVHEILLGLNRGGSLLVTVGHLERFAHDSGFASLVDMHAFMKGPAECSLFIGQFVAWESHPSNARRAA